MYTYYQCHVLMHGSQNRAEDPEQDHNYLVRDLYLLACGDQLVVHTTEFTGLGGPIGNPYQLAYEIQELDFLYHAFWLICYIN